MDKPDHPSGEQVDDGAQVQPTFMSADVGDVGHPSLIGLALQVVWCHQCWLAATRDRSALITSL